MMFDCVADGQISLFDYFKNPALNIKPKRLADYINGLGESQYKQIKKVITHALEVENCNLPDEVIERLTNNVSVWLLEIGFKYDAYLRKLLQGDS